MAEPYTIMKIENQSSFVACERTVAAHHSTRALPGGRIVLRRIGADEAERLGLWDALLAASESQEKIYQSPAFYRFLERCSGGDQVALLAVTREGDARVTGLLPVRYGPEELHLGIGKLPSLAPRLNVVRMLGSLPMPASESCCDAELMEALFAVFPQADAISMQAVPYDSHWWQNLLPSLRRRAYVFHGWRECHTIPLPESFELYLKQFSAKKRYNLTRQVKQLAQQAGEIGVERVTAPAQVPAMLAAARALAGAAEQQGMLSEEEYRALAEQGLLLSYVISCAGTPCGAVIGSLFGGVWHVYKILYDARYASLSIGTSVLHVSIQDALDALRPTLIDLGYGSPKREFGSSHRTVRRAHVLLYRARLRTRLRIGTHAWATRVAVPVRSAVKRWRDRAAGARQA